MQNERLVLITGATSGIGKATAELFAAQGVNLILCGRRQDRLLKLKSELSGKCAVHTLCFDVCDRSATFGAIDALPESFSKIDILINNAGNAHGLAPIDSGEVADWDAMIDGNVKGLLYVTKAVLPSMLERGVGHIINIGSIAGKEVYPNGNVYCASKHAVDALSEAMRIDLVSKGIKVSVVHPGLVETEFSLVRFKGDKERAKKTYQNFKVLSAADVADVIAYMVNAPAHVNLADVMILPTAQASTTVSHKSAAS